VHRSRFRQFLIRRLQQRSGRVPSISAACLMIRRDAFEQIRGYDNDFELYFEDSDLCLRCSEAGWQIDFVSDAKIVHHLGQSTRGSWNSTSLIYQQSHIAFYRKHVSAWAVSALKLYLLLKWARLRWVASREREDKNRAMAYCSTYLRMIFEKEKITLEDGIPYT
jgi:GT2 family glycosyltransferase